MRKRQWNLAPPLVGGLLLVATLCLYAGAYLDLGNKKELLNINTGKTSAVLRWYPYSGCRYLFQPAAQIEYQLRGVPVTLCWTGDPDPFD